MPDPVEILLADDSEVGRYVIATMLRRAGFVVREVPDGLEAVREATSRPPDLVILDVKMPGLDGLEACRRLKADPSAGRRAERAPDRHRVAGDLRCDRRRGRAGRSRRRGPAV